MVELREGDKMATIDLRTEAKQILDGLSDESLTVAVNLLTALKNNQPPEQAMEDFANCVESQSEPSTKSEIDWLDTEYMEQARREVKNAISLEEARAILAKISGSLSDTIINIREERF
jgi:hypothetical protein